MTIQDFLDYVNRNGIPYATPLNLSTADGGTEDFSGKFFSHKVGEDGTYSMTLNVGETAAKSAEAKAKAAEEVRAVQTPGNTLKPNEQKQREDDASATPKAEAQSKDDAPKAKTADSQLKK